MAASTEAGSEPTHRGVGGIVEGGEQEQQGRRDGSDG